MWLLKTKLLPWLYWNRMLPDYPHEGRHLKPRAPLVHALRLDYRPPLPAAIQWPLARVPPTAAGSTTRMSGVQQERLFSDWIKSKQRNQREAPAEQPIGHGKNGSLIPRETSA
jgi:hypothetical protein